MRIVGQELRTVLLHKSEKKSLVSADRLLKATDKPARPPLVELQHHGTARDRFLPVSMWRCRFLRIAYIIPVFCICGMTLADCVPWNEKVYYSISNLMLCIFYALCLYDIARDPRLLFHSRAGLHYHRPALYLGNVV